VTTKANGFEGGTAGVQLATGNLGGVSGDAPDTVTATGQFVFDAAHPAHGSMSAKVNGAGTTGFVSYNLNTPTLFARQYLYLTELPTSDQFTMRFYNTVLPGNVAILKWISTGALRLTDSAGTTRWTSSAIFPTTSIIRVDAYVNVTTNSFQIAWGPLDAAATQDSTLLTTAVFGGANITRLDIGPRVTAGTSTATAITWMDDVRLTYPATGFDAPGVPAVQTNFVRRAGVWVPMNVYHRSAGTWHAI
jgi:hypothetical protein